MEFSSEVECLLMQNVTHLDACSRKEFFKKQRLLHWSVKSIRAFRRNQKSDRSGVRKTATDGLRISTSVLTIQSLLTRAPKRNISAATSNFQTRNLHANSPEAELCMTRTPSKGGQQPWNALSQIKWKRQASAGHGPFLWKVSELPAPSTWIFSTSINRQRRAQRRKHLIKRKPKLKHKMLRRYQKRIG